MEWIEFFSTQFGENTLGALLIAAFFTVVGLFIKGFLQNHGLISVAKIEASVSLNDQAIQVMTSAMEALRDENHALKTSVAQIESHMDQIIELLILMIRAKSEGEVQTYTLRLEQLLKAIGRWPYP